MSNEVAPDGVVHASIESNLQLCAHSICRRYQNRLADFGKRSVEHSAKAPNLRKRARIESCSREFFDFLSRAIGGVDVHAGGHVSCGFAFQ